MVFRLPEDCDPSIRQIYEYWCSIHPVRGLPGRQHFDPVDVSALLPHLWMADVEREPMRFRFRLIGSAIVQILGKDVTGYYLDESFDNFDDSAPSNTMIEISVQGTPAWRRGDALLVRKNYRVKNMERILLPLARDGKTVDMFLALSVYVAEDEFARTKESCEVHAH